MKLVRESLFEKFSEEGDAIHDMGIGLLPEYEKKLAEKYKWSRDAIEDAKDRMRVRDIIDKAKGDSNKENKLAETMCKLIGDAKKAYRRYLAAKGARGSNWEVTRIFLRRAADLAGIK